MKKKQKPMPYFLNNHTACSSSCDYVRRTIEGDAGFVCPECHSGVVSKIKLVHERRVNDTVGIKIKVHYNVRCPGCGSVYTWYDDPLDPNITPYIAQLNGKGYETIFSCEGHKGNHQAYIMFRGNLDRIAKVLETYPLPYPWYSEMNDVFDVPLCCIVKRLVIRCDDPSLKVRMESLGRWTDMLPILTK